MPDTDAVGPVIRNRLSISLAGIIALAVAGCATIPSGPRVMVVPGAHKDFDQFRADQASCQEYAHVAIGGVSASDSAANSAAASAIAGTALGAAAGAIIGSASGNAGQGAAIGAGAGLLFGSAAGSNAAGLTYYEAQRRYDMAYVQCMYARGNHVPGRTAYRSPYPSYPPPNTPAPDLSQGSSPPPRAAAPRPPSATTRPPVPPARTPPPASGAPTAPPADYPPSSYPPPDTPPPPGVKPIPG